MVKLTNVNTTVRISKLNSMGILILDTRSLSGNYRVIGAINLDIIRIAAISHGNFIDKIRSKLKC